jgi:hypothetical protein
LKAAIELRLRRKIKLLQLDPPASRAVGAATRSALRRVISRAGVSAAGAAGSANRSHPVFAARVAADG